MNKRKRSIQQLIEEQMKRWQITRFERNKQETESRVITISREPGSGGRLVAEKVAQTLNFDLFHEIFLPAAE